MKKKVPSTADRATPTFIEPMYAEVAQVLPDGEMSVPNCFLANGLPSCTHTITVDCQSFASETSRCK